MPETLKADLDHDFANDGKAHRIGMSEDLDTIRGWSVKAADAYTDGGRQLTEMLHLSGRFTITPEYAEALSATPKAAARIDNPALAAKIRNSCYMKNSTVAIRVTATLFSWTHSAEAV